MLGFPTYPHLAAIIYPIPNYRVFLIPKRNGSHRTIHAPTRKVKAIQQQLLPALQELEASRDAVHGFRADRSIVTNAGQHAYGRKTFVLNLDLKDFFPSISFYRVRGLFGAEPFLLNPTVANVLAHICCYKGFLPQGAPTSPTISNMICRSLDGALQKLARESRATYTRYADDLTFSFSVKRREHLPERVVVDDSATPSVGAELESVIQAQGFAVNHDKIRLLRADNRLEVTGLTVNTVPNVRRTYVNEIRGALNVWEHYGLANAQAAFEARKYNRQTRSGKTPKFEKYLHGKMLYLKMVKTESDRVYIKLARRYNALVGATPTCRSPQIKVAAVVSDEAELENAVYRISCEDDAKLQYREGTAFFLRDVGVVTCAHVLAYPVDETVDLPRGYFGHTAGSILLKDRFGNALCALEVVQLNDHADLAVLRPVGNGPGKTLFLDESHMTITRGSEVHLAGFPDTTHGKGLSIVRSHVAVVYPRSGIDYIDINEQIQHGNSGGPVLDSQLRVVGVAARGQINMNGSNQVVRMAMLNQLKGAGLMAPPSTAVP